MKKLEHSVVVKVSITDPLAPQTAATVLLSWTAKGHSSNAYPMGRQIVNECRLFWGQDQARYRATPAAVSRHRGVGAPISGWSFLESPSVLSHPVSEHVVPYFNAASLVRASRYHSSAGEIPTHLDQAKDAGFVRIPVVIRAAYPVDGHGNVHLEPCCSSMSLHPQSSLSQNLYSLILTYAHHHSFHSWKR